jgi:hypothetical protein
MLLSAGPLAVNVVHDSMNVPVVSAAASSGDSGANHNAQAVQLVMADEEERVDTELVSSPPNSSEEVVAVLPVVEDTIAGLLVVGDTNAEVLLPFPTEVHSGPIIGHAQSIGNRDETPTVTFSEDEQLEGPPIVATALTVLPDDIELVGPPIIVHCLVDSELLGGDVHSETEGSSQSD